MQEDLTPDVEDLDALSSSTRISILDSMAFKPKTPSDIASELKKSQLAIIEHLNILIINGFVTKLSSNDKKYVFYTLSEKGKSVVHSSKKITLVLYVSAIFIVFGAALNVLAYTKPFGVYSASVASILGAQSAGQALSPAYYLYWLAIIFGAAGLVFYIFRSRRLGDSLF